MKAADRFVIVWGAHPWDLNYDAMSLPLFISGVFISGV